MNCGKDESLTKTKIIQNLPEQETENFNLVHTHKGEKKWELKAKNAYFFERGERIELKAVYVEFYSEEDGNSFLTADSGIVNERTYDMKALGNVVLMNEKGKRIESQGLNWENRKERLTTEDWVRVVDGGDTLEGVGLETDSHLRRIVLKKVKSKIRTSEDNNILPKEIKK